VSVHPILVYGDPRLEMPSVPVEEFTQELADLARDLFEAGWKAPGLGLAAPQIGVNQRVAVIDLSVGKDPDQQLVLVNPEIVDRQGRTALEEGCLSFPGLFTSITRPKILSVRFQDLGGEVQEMTAEGLLAQAVCHELDHLDGTLLVHHLTGLKRRMFLRRIAKMRDLGVWPQVA